MPRFICPSLGWHFEPILIVLVVVLSLISEMTGVLGLMVGASRHNCSAALHHL
jgi:hypothetical protein